MNCGPDLAALNGRVARAMVAGDQQYNALIARYGLFKRAVDRLPRRVQVHAVKIEDAVGFDGAAAQPFVPAAVQRRMVERPGARLRLLRGSQPFIPFDRRLVND
jgi:hypothetical protein